VRIGAQAPESADCGGACAGVAHRLDPARLEPALETLLKREMIVDSYMPKWLACSFDNGKKVRALAFVTRRSAGNYAGRLEEDVIRLVFERASGTHGTTRDYVASTVDALRAYGIRDASLERILQRCDTGPGCGGLAVPA